MKKVFLLLALMGLFVLACQKNENLGNEITDTNLQLLGDEDANASFVEDVIQFADLYTAFDEMFFLKSAELEACPKITKESPKDKLYPMTITMDFGTGCTALDGKKKSGKMIIVKSGPWTEKNATRKISFENFVVDGVKMEGEQKATHESMEAGKQTIRWQGEVKMTRADGSWVNRSENITRTITGYNTPILTDNKLEVDGTSEVSRSDKTTFSRKITRTLVRLGDCRHFTDGIAKIEKTGTEYTIDYGFSKSNELCDKWVLITKGSEKKEVQLK